MPTSITRAADRVAIWHYAADDEPEIPEYESYEDPAPDMTAMETAGPPPEGPTIPKGNKFNKPANAAKKLLETLPNQPLSDDTSGHPALADWLMTPTGMGFSKYLKPANQEMLKAHLGEENYNKLNLHLPEAHFKQLTTEPQKPAPASNKFTKPANGLKTLLDNPQTTPEHVQSWIDKHPAFAKSYLHNPAYQDAIKAHVGKQNYEDWQEHLTKPGEKPADTPAKAEPSYVEKTKQNLEESLGKIPGIKPMTQEEFFGPGGPAAPGLGPKAPAKKEEGPKGVDTDALNKDLARIFGHGLIRFTPDQDPEDIKTELTGPDWSEDPMDTQSQKDALQQVIKKHFGPQATQAAHQKNLAELATNLKAHYPQYYTDTDDYKKWEQGLMPGLAAQLAQDPDAAAAHFNDFLEHYYEDEQEQPSADPDQFLQKLHEATGKTWGEGWADPYQAENKEGLYNHAAGGLGYVPPQNLPKLKALYEEYHGKPPGGWPGDYPSDEELDALGILPEPEVYQPPTTQGIGDKLHAVAPNFSATSWNNHEKNNGTQSALDTLEAHLQHANYPPDQKAALEKILKEHGQAEDISAIKKEIQGPGPGVGGIMGGPLLPVLQHPHVQPSDLSEWFLKHPGLTPKNAEDFLSSDPEWATEYAKFQELMSPPHAPDQPHMTADHNHYTPQFKKWLTDKYGIGTDDLYQQFDNDEVKEILNNYKHQVQLESEQQPGQAPAFSGGAPTQEFKKWYQKNYGMPLEGVYGDALTNAAKAYQESQQAHGYNDLGIPEVLALPGNTTQHVQNWLQSTPGQKWSDTWLYNGKNAHQQWINMPWGQEILKHLTPEQKQQAGLPVGNEDEIAQIQQLLQPTGPNTPIPGLGDAIKKIIPDTPSDWDHMTPPEAKGHLENILKHLSDHPGYSQQIPALQKLYDQHFGEGAAPAAPPLITPGQAALDPFQMGKDWQEVTGSPHSWDFTKPNQVNDLKSFIEVGLKGSPHTDLTPEQLPKAKAFYQKYFGPPPAEQAPEEFSWQDEAAKAGALGPGSYGTGKPQFTTDFMNWVKQEWGPGNLASAIAHVQELKSDPEGFKDLMKAYQQATTWVGGTPHMDAWGDLTPEFKAWFKADNAFDLDKDNGKDDLIKMLTKEPGNHWTQTKINGYKKYLSQQVGISQNIHQQNLDTIASQGLGLQPGIPLSDDAAEYLHSLSPDFAAELAQDPHNVAQDFSEWLDSKEAGYSDEEPEYPHEFDPNAFLKEYKATYPHTTWGPNELGTAAQAKQVLENILEEDEDEALGNPENRESYPAAGDYEDALNHFNEGKIKAQMLYNKWFPTGAMATEEHPPAPAGQQLSTPPPDEFFDELVASGVLPQNMGDSIKKQIHDQPGKWAQNAAAWGNSSEMTYASDSAWGKAMQAWQDKLSGKAAPGGGLGDKIKTLKPTLNAKIMDYLNKASPEDAQKYINSMTLVDNKKLFQEAFDEHYGKGAGGTKGLGDHYQTINPHALPETIKILNESSPADAQQFINTLGPISKGMMQKAFDEYYGKTKAPPQGGGMPYEQALALVKQKYPYFDNDTSVKDLPSLKKKLNDWLTGITLQQSHVDDAKDFLAQIEGGGGAQQPTAENIKNYILKNFHYGPNAELFTDLEGKSPEEMKAVLEHELRWHEVNGSDDGKAEIQDTIDHFFGGQPSMFDFTGYAKPGDNPQFKSWVNAQLDAYDLSVKMYNSLLSSPVVAKAYVELDPTEKENVTLDTATQNQWVNQVKAQAPAGYTPEQHGQFLQDIKGHLKNDGYGNENQMDQFLNDLDTDQADQLAHDPIGATQAYEDWLGGPTKAQQPPGGLTLSGLADFAKTVLPPMSGTDPQEWADAVWDQHGSEPEEVAQYLAGKYPKAWGKFVEAGDLAKGQTWLSYFPKLNGGDPSAVIMMSPEKQQELLETWANPETGTPETANAAKQMLHKYFGGPAPAAEGFDKQQLANDLADIWGVGPDNPFIKDVMATSTPEAAEKVVEQKYKDWHGDGTEQPTSTAAKIKAVMDKHFGAGAPIPDALKSALLQYIFSDADSENIQFWLDKSPEQAKADIKSLASGISVNSPGVVLEPYLADKWQKVYDQLYGGGAAPAQPNKDDIIKAVAQHWPGSANAMADDSLDKIKLKLQMWASPSSTPVNQAKAQGILDKFFPGEVGQRESFNAVNLTQEVADVLNMVPDSMTHNSDQYWNEMSADEAKDALTDLLSGSGGWSDEEKAGLQQIFDKYFGKGTKPTAAPSAGTVPFDANQYAQDLQKADPKYWSPGGAGHEGIAIDPEEAKDQLETYIHDAENGNFTPVKGELEQYKAMYRKYFMGGEAIQAPQTQQDKNDQIEQIYNMALAGQFGSHTLDDDLMDYFKELSPEAWKNKIDYWSDPDHPPAPTSAWATIIEGLKALGGGDWKAPAGGPQNFEQAWKAAFPEATQAPTKEKMDQYLASGTYHGDIEAKIKGLYNQYFGLTPEQITEIGDLSTFVPPDFTELDPEEQKEQLADLALDHLDAGDVGISMALEKILGQLQGKAGPAEPEKIPPNPPFNWEQFSKEFKDMAPGSGWADQVGPGDQDPEEKIKSALAGALSGPPEWHTGEKWDKINAIYQKWFPQGYHDFMAQQGEPAKPPFNSPAVAQALQDIDPGAWSDADVADVANQNEAWQKANLAALIQQGLKGDFSADETGKYMDLYQKYWGELPPGMDKAELAGIQAIQENLPPAEPPKPFKSGVAKPEDVQQYAENRPQSAAGWKNFTTWWGNNQLTPEQEQGLYKAWHGKDVSPEAANAWFAAMFEQQSEPAEADLGITEGVPAWANAAWAFGKNAPQQWPVFQAWATQHPGIPAGANIKQKVAIWNSLTPEDKHDFADEYMPPAVAVDTVIHALQAAYPDSDWSKWAKMSQPVLAKNLKNLAAAGYAAPATIYNEYFGGHLPVPEEPKEGEAPAAPPLPTAALPTWFKDNIGTGQKNAQDFAGYLDWAKSVGKAQEAAGKDPNYPSSDYPPDIWATWKGLPEHIKGQLAAMGSAKPWSDWAGFFNWYHAQPDLKTALQQIYPGQSIPSGAAAQVTALGKMIQAEKDPDQKAALASLLAQYHGAGRATLAEGLKGVYPEQDWDKQLKGKSRIQAANLLKKALKNEQDPVKFAQLADLWSAHLRDTNPNRPAKIAKTGIPELDEFFQQARANTSGPLSVSELQELQYWKEQGGDPNKSIWYSDPPGGWTPSDFITNREQNPVNKNDFMPYFAYTPPGGGAATGFKMDPALYGQIPPVATYELPPMEGKSKELQALQKKVEGFVAGYFSPTDRKILKSDDFANWFNRASPGYRDQMRDHPSLALDDYQTFVNGGPTYSPAPEGMVPPEADPDYDMSGYGDWPEIGTINPATGQPYPYGLTKNPQRAQESASPQLEIGFPTQPQHQETLPLGPGEHFLPQGGPMPIYRVMNLELNSVRGVPKHIKGDKERELYKMEQEARLRQIDEIVNGTHKARNIGHDLSHFQQWARTHHVPDEEKVRLLARLFSSVHHPVLDHDERWQEFVDEAPKLGLDPSQLENLAKRLGIIPTQAPQGNYDHPDLGRLVMDYLSMGARADSQDMGIGPHWTRDKDKAYNGVGSVTPWINHPSHTSIPVTVSGLWTGQGEGIGANAAYPPNRNSEREHNLAPFAPVHIRRVQIRSPDMDWHDVIDYGPMSLWPIGRDETASGKIVRDKPSLVEELQKVLPNVHFDKGKWDYLKPGHQTDQLFSRLLYQYAVPMRDPNGQVVVQNGKVQVERPDIEKKLDKLYRNFFVGRPDLTEKPHMRRANLAPIPPVTAVAVPPDQLYRLAVLWDIPHPERYGKIPSRQEAKEFYDDLKGALFTQKSLAKEYGFGIPTVRTHLPPPAWRAVPEESEESPDLVHLSRIAVLDDAFSAAVDEVKARMASAEDPGEPIIRRAAAPSRRALIVVDPQNDFISGSLAVPRGEQAATRLAGLMSHPNHGYDHIVTTQDWHIDPGGHFSKTPDYAESWPEHGKAGTWGAELHPAVAAQPVSERFYKGQYSPGYSGFEGTTQGGEPLADWLHRNGITHTDVAGIATDKCVHATARDAASNGFHTRVLPHYSAPVTDEGEQAALADLQNNYGIGIAQGPQVGERRAKLADLQEAIVILEEMTC
jgi:nicotinamidase/pyrazinamidase